LTTLEKQEMISNEITELTRITKDVSKDKRAFVDRLINQAAFMCATLNELQGILNTDGAIELFEQGVQKMLREHPAAKTYNTMIKNYISIIKQLSEIVPPEEGEKDPLKEFLNKKVGK
jgi:hypothetical protein